MMATNSNVPAAEPGVFGPRRRGTAHGRSPRLVDAQELWDIDDVASYLGVTKQTTEPRGVVGFEVILGAYASLPSIAATVSVLLVS